MSSPNPPGWPPQPPPPPVPAAKSPNNVLKWVLIGVGALVVCGVLAVGAGTYFLYRTVRNAGFDPDLMQRNPGLALARMAGALNPDADIISTDESSGTVTIREKSTGKTVTLRFDPDKKSMVVVNGEGQQAEIKISGDEKSGSLEVTGNNGDTVKFGAASGNSAPGWAPVYPGSSPQGTMSAQTGEGSQSTFSFKTKDPAPQVLSYYENQLKSGGFNITLSTKGEQGGMITAEDGAKKRTLMVTAGSSGEGTEGSVTAVEKK